MKLHLRSQGTWWVVQPTTLSTTPSTTSEASTQSSRPVQPVGRFFEQDDSAAMLAMMQSMSEDDQQEMEDKETASELWNTLEIKYKESLMTHARQYLKSYVNFEVTGTIDEAWSQLHTLARRIVTIRPELRVLDQPSERIQVLLGALPDAYSSLVDTIDGQSDLKPSQIFARLQEKEAQLGPVQSPSQDTALVARLKRAGLRCFLCQKPHGVLDCPWLDTCQRYIKQKEKKKQKQKQRESDSSESDSSTRSLSILKRDVERISAALDKKKEGAKGKRIDRAFFSVDQFGPNCFDQHGMLKEDPEDCDYENGFDCDRCGLRLPIKKDNAVQVEGEC